MEDALSEVIKEAYATARSNAVELTTLEVSHPSLPDGSLFLVQDFVGHNFTLEDSTVQYFEPAGFSVKLPNKTSKGFADLNLAFDNTNRRVSDFLKDTLQYPNESVSIKLRPYLLEDPTTPQMNPPLELYLSTASVNALTVSGTASFADILNKAFLSNTYNRTRFPAL